MISDTAPAGTTIAEMTEDQHRHDKSVEYFKIVKGRYPRNLLDIGCGNGYITDKIRKVLGMEYVYGVDIQCDELDTPVWLRISKADFNWDRLPYPDSSFDAIYCGETIEHLYNPDNLLSEIRRVLAHGGTCLITTPNLASWYNRISLLLGYQPFCTSVSYYNESIGKFPGVKVYGQRDHVRLFTLKSLIDLLKINGLKVTNVMGWDQGLIQNHLKYSIVSRTAGFIDIGMSKVPSFASRLAVSVTK